MLSCLIIIATMVINALHDSMYTSCWMWALSNEWASLFILISTICCSIFHLFCFWQKYQGFKFITLENIRSTNNIDVMTWHKLKNSLLLLLRVYVSPDAVSKAMHLWMEIKFSSICQACISMFLSSLTKSIQLNYTHVDLIIQMLN